MQFTFVFLPSFGCRSFVPICSSKTSSQPSWSKSCQQRNHGERASTLPRIKPKTYSSPTLSAKPSISIFPAPKPNSSPTLKPKPSDSLHPPASQFSDPSPLLHQPPPKPSVSPTLTVPTPRLSPSPTSLCQGLDSRGGKQPSPVAIERRARSIAISNTNVEPVKQRSSNEAKYDVLDQEALLDFTHPALRRACPMSRHQTEAAMSLNSCLLQGKVGLRKKENIAKDKPKPPPRNLDITSIPKPKSNIKQQQGFLPSGATGTQTESEGIKFGNVVQREAQSAFDVPATQSRKRLDYLQRRNYTCNDQSFEQMYSERLAASPLTPKISFSTEPLLNQSPNIETRRRRFDFSGDTKMDLSNLRRPREDTWISTGNSSKLSQQTNASQIIKTPQKHRFWSKSQTIMDVKSPVSQSDYVSKDYSCQLRDIDRETEPPQCAHRLNPLKTCLVAPQEASRPASVESTTSKTTFSKPDIISHKPQFDHKHNKSHKEVNVGDTGLNQTDIFTPSEHHGVPAKLPEYPSGKYCPFNTNSFGISSKGVCDLLSQPQHRVYQRPDETTASPPLHRPNYPPADRAFIMEEPEDPYYVTMYYPGSVYVGEYRDFQTSWKLNKVKQSLTAQIAGTLSSLAFNLF